jgi:hypothetical protein
MKKFPTLMYHARVFRSLNFDVGFELCAENGGELIEYFYIQLLSFDLKKK